MEYFYIATGIAFVSLLALVWAWFGLITLIRHIRANRLIKQYRKENYKRLAEKYRKKNEGLANWERPISNNLPELIEDIKLINKK